MSFRGEAPPPKLNKKEKMKKSLNNFLSKMKNRGSEKGSNEAEENKESDAGKTKAVSDVIKEEAKEEDDLPEVTHAERKETPKGVTQDSPTKKQLTFKRGPPTTF